MPRVRGHERNVAVQVGPLFGIDIRPTRVFLWLGRGLMERVVPLGGTPKPVPTDRPQRALRLGPVRLWSLGNPGVTIAQAAVSALVGPDDALSAPRRLPRRSSSRSRSPSTSSR